MADPDMSTDINFVHSAYLYVCGVDSDRILKLIQSAKENVDFAADLSAKGSYIPKASGHFKKAKSAFDDASGKLGKAEGVITDLDALCKIGSALETLSNWNEGDNSTTDEEAAKAFDKLFGAAATFFEKNPILKPFAQLLKQCSVSQFFTHMHNLGQSRVGGNGMTPTGRAMQQINREFKRQGSGGIH